MSNRKDIACIGHDENAMIFNSSGISGYVASHENLNKIVNDLIEQQVKIIIISNYFKDEVEEYRRLNKNVYPIYLLLDMDGFKTDSGYESLRKDVERATGINIL